MTGDFRSQVDELYEQAYGLPDGPSKLALLEEAIRLADTHQDAALGDEIRADLVRAATFSGYPEKALVAFSWRLAQADRDPDNFSEDNLPRPRSTLRRSERQRRFHAPLVGQRSLESMVDSDSAALNATSLFVGDISLRIGPRLRRRIERDDRH